MKKVSGSLKLELAQYHELLSFTQFGSDLDPVTKAIIDHGAKLTELLKQKQYSPLTMEYQVISIYAAKHGYLKDITVEQVNEFETELHTFFRTSKSELVNKLRDEGVLTEEIDSGLKLAMDQFVSEFKMTHGV